MSVTKCKDVAYVRFSAPDLDKMHQFLTDFGMVTVDKTDTKLTMRTYGISPYCHITELGETKFTAFGIWVDSEKELAALAAHDNVTVEDLDEPGGGKVVRLTDPDGFIVEAIAGQKMVDALPTEKPVPWNQAGQVLRASEERKETRDRPSYPMRLGHVVLNVSNFRASEAWYKERFGFITSDEVQPETGKAIAAFLRCDRGDKPTDHHTIFLAQMPGGPCFWHAAFEVRDVDDLMIGHEFLKNKGHQAQWGIGRHILGSAVFDYWKDPWGHELEHWVDGDLHVNSDQSRIRSMADFEGVYWGMPLPPPPQP